MCTVSWLRTPGAYQLLCNRDEKRTRPIASPPQFHQEGDLRIIAPRDAQGGGTWIAANSAGISIALLNGNGRGPAAQQAKSRGLLPLHLIRLASTDQILHRLEASALNHFPPFHLLIFQPDGPIHRLNWNGVDSRLSVDDSPFGFVTSSSFEPAAVGRSRAALFDRMKTRAGAISAELLYSFHESHGQTPGAHSPCMHRPDAETVSFSWIQVTPPRVSVFYSPGAPCQWLPGSTLVVPRTAHGGNVCSPHYSGSLPARSSAKTSPASPPAL